MTDLIIAGATGAFLVILGFILNVLYEIHRERNKTRNEGLKNTLMNWKLKSSSH